MERTARLSMMLATAAGLIAADVAVADDMPLIWVPQKESDTAISARLGVRAPGASFASAGVEMGVQSNTPGGRVDAPVKFWGRLAVEAIKTPASSVTRDVNLRINALTGGGTVAMTYTDQQILDEDYKLALSRDYVVRYDGEAGSWSGVDVSQSVRLLQTGTGTTFLVKAGALDTFSRIGGGVGVEQTLGDHISLTGNLDRAAGSDLTASINARYSVTW